MADTANVIGYAEKPYEMYDSASKYVGKVADKYDEAIKVSDWLNDGANLAPVKSTRRLAAGSKAIGYAGIILDAGATYAERMEEGYDSAEASGRAAVNAGTKAGFSWACTKGGTAVGAKIGSAICPGAGTAIGAAVGFLGGMLVDFFWGDDVGDWVEEVFYD